MPQTINQSTASGNVGVSSYGGLYENSAGSTITVTTAGTYYGWTTATVGTVAGTGFVTADVANATADNLTIGTSGAGTYLVTLSVCYSGTANSTAVGAIHVDGVPQTNITLRRKLGTGGDVGSASATGILKLEVGNVVDLRFTADGNGDTVVVQRVNLAIARIG